MRLNKILKLLLVFILLFFLVKSLGYIFQRFIYPHMAQSAVSEYRDDVYNAQYSFKVIRKYRDSLNHNNTTVVGLDSNNAEKSIVGTLEFENLYNMVTVGDTIVKKNKTYDFLIRNRMEKKFHYVYNGN
jgi:hypothetical protein